MADDPRLGLARRLYERTGSREDTLSGLVNLGYGKAESQAVVDQVAPPAPKPAAPPATPKTPPAGGKARKGSPSNPDPTSSPRPPAGSPSLDLPRPTLKPPKRLGAGDVAGFGFGLVLYTLALQYLRYGPGGPTGWLGAKLLNRPSAPSTVSDRWGDKKAASLATDLAAADDNRATFAPPPGSGPLTTTKVQTPGGESL